MIDNIALGQRVKSLRKTKHMSQLLLAKLIDKPVQRIKDIESGEGLGEDDLEVAVDLALVLDTSLEYLFNGTENAPSLKDVLRRRKLN